jgi:CMP-N-acetylneuraminic acid synthetase
MEIVGIIPVRAGSKRIPDKWKAKINGVPLSMITLALADKLYKRGYLSSILVTSDSEDFLMSFYGDGYVRDHAFPISDTDQIESRLITLFNERKALDLDPVICCMLQITSPLRTFDDVVGAIELFGATMAENPGKSIAVVSCWETRAFEWRWGTLGKKIIPTYDLKKRPTTQEKSKDQGWSSLYENGAIYIFESDQLLKTGTRLTADIVVPYIMPHERSHEIDTPEDIALVERLLGNT